MPRNSDGTYTLPSSPVLPGTPISPSNENEFRADVAEVLTRTLSREGDGGMVAPLRLTSGSASNPSLTFTDSPALGLWNPSANVVEMVAAATAIQRWSTTGVYIYRSLAVTGNLSATGSFIVSGSSTFELDAEFQDSVTFQAGTTTYGVVDAYAGGQAFNLRAGPTQNHVYLGFFARSATPGVRSGFFGYGAAAATTASWMNAIGDIAMSATGKVFLATTGNVVVTGAALVRTDNNANTLAPGSMVQVRGFVALTSGNPATATCPTQGLNIASALVQTGNNRLRITFVVPFANTNYTVAVGNGNSAVGSWYVFTKTLTYVDMAVSVFSYDAINPANSANSQALFTTTSLPWLDIVCVGEQ